MSDNPDLQRTVAKNRKRWMKFIFPLKLLAQLDPSFAKIVFWWSPFKICLSVLLSDQDGRCCYKLTIPWTLGRMQGFACLITSYKTNMFRLFQWNTVGRRIWYLCFIVPFFYKDSSCFKYKKNVALRWHYMNHDMFAGCSLVVFSGAKRYVKVTNANLDNTGLAYFLPLLHKKCGLFMN